MAKRTKTPERSLFTIAEFNDMKRTETTETDVQKRTVKILRALPNVLVQKVKNEIFVRYMSDASQHKVLNKSIAEGLIPGASDLIMVLGRPYWQTYPNCIFFLELKKWGKNPGPKQLAYKEMVERLGFHFIKIDCVEQAYQLYDLIANRQPIPEELPKTAPVPNYRRNPQSHD